MHLESEHSPGFRDTVLGHVRRAICPSWHLLYLQHFIFQLVLVVNLHYKINLCADLTIKAVNLLARFFFSGEKKLFPFPRTHYSRREKRQCVAHTQYGSHAHTTHKVCRVLTTDSKPVHVSVLTEPCLGSFHSHRSFPETIKQLSLHVKCRV